MSIAWFVSPHGMGHAARTAAIVDALPENVSVSVFGTIPDWFWEERFSRRCSRHSFNADIGCVQQSTWSIDREATLRKVAALLASMEHHVDSLARTLSEGGYRLVVSDIAWLPIAAAHRAGIPSVLVANFTWCSIYGPWEGSADLVSALARVYGLADHSLVPGPAVAMPELRKSTPIPWIAATGRDRRDELFRRFAHGHRLALVLPGAWGTDFPWERLSSVSGWRFVVLQRGEEAPRGLLGVDAARYCHADVVASVDAVIGKPGYGTVGECAAAGTPMLFASRPEFAESKVLEDWMLEHRLGVEIVFRDFSGCHWQAGLDRLAAMPRPVAKPCDGAETAARLVVRWWQDSIGKSAK